jgi:hypothetical protein
MADLLKLGFGESQFLRDGTQAGGMRCFIAAK